MRKVEYLMGMPISIDLPEVDNNQVFDEVFSLFTRIESEYSPFKENSLLCQYQRGEITELNVGNEFKLIMAQCQELKSKTNGYFSAYFDKAYNPTGMVKGWAIQQAAELLNLRNVKTYLLNAGGDILAKSEGEKDWKIAIRHPLDKKEQICMLSSCNLAVATSGNYERGRHIINPLTGELSDQILSITIVGRSILEADAFATAGFAMGKDAIRFLEQETDYEGILVTDEMELMMTSKLAQQVCC